MKVEIPEKLKHEMPEGLWGKILAATPVIMAVVSTLLAGLSSSEMTQAQYDRSLGAQQQAKAGDQWSFFQAKRLRSANERSTLDILRAATIIVPFDPGAVRASIEKVHQPQILAQFNSKFALAALDVLAHGKLPHPPGALSLETNVQAAVNAMAADRPESEISPLAARVKPRAVDEGLALAVHLSRAFDSEVKPLGQEIDRLGALLDSVPALNNESRSLAAARLRFTQLRYDGESQLNQNIAFLYELKVRLSNLSADHHHARSDKFFDGMLAAQAAVIVSTFAMAARQKNLLWTIAALAGLIAVLLAVYVYLYV